MQLNIMWIPFPEGINIISCYKRFTLAYYSWTHTCRKGKNYQGKTCSFLDLSEKSFGELYLGEYQKTLASKFKLQSIALTYHLKNWRLKAIPESPQNHALTLVQ